MGQKRKEKINVEIIILNKPSKLAIENLNKMCQIVIKETIEEKEKLELLS